jgi:hypothetical protein
MGRTSAVLVIATSVFLAFPLFAQNSKASSNQPIVAKDYSFSVPAHEVWIDTGLDLQPGQLVHVYGGVIACGGPAPSEKETLPLPSAPAGALLAKLHPDAKPVLATPDAELPVIDPSHLYLGINHTYCSGSALAKVHVGPAQATQ